MSAGLVIVHSHLVRQLRVERMVLALLLPSTLFSYTPRERLTTVFAMPWT